ASFNASTGLWQSNSIPAGDSGSPVAPVSTIYNDANDPWVIVRTDEEAKVHKYAVDAFGRTNQIIEVSLGGNYTTTLGNDKLGVLTSVQDYLGNSIHFLLNDLGQEIAMADPDLGVWENRRDFAGRLREQ